jgi:hypothetical protein
MDRISMTASRLRLIAGTLLSAVPLATVMISGQQNPPPPAAPAQGAPAGAPGRGRGPQEPMSFFITSVGKGNGGNLGGLAGADAQCQQLAAAAGRGGVTWHAYLSTQGPNAVNARDRIGKGPWYNARGQVIAAGIAELHGDTLEQARIGNFIGVANSLDEKGQPVPNGFPGSEHDILTGSTLEGRAYTDNTRDYTCNNWTSSAAGTVANPGPGVEMNAPGLPSARVGHADKGNIVPSWNSSHATPGCSQMNLNSIGGAGRLYCFAVN